ncbi:TPA: hypothetical protein ACFORT_000298 [Neisseria meningitidis]
MLLAFVFAVCPAGQASFRFAIADAVRRGLEARQPKGRVEVDVI